MAKLNLQDLANLTSENTAIVTINDNSHLIEQAVESTLSRDGTSPNEMLADLDMNSNRVLNLPEPQSDTEPLRKIDGAEILGAVDEVLEARDEAQEAASDAQQAAGQAASSASSAANSAQSAADSADEAQEAVEGMAPLKKPVFTEGPVSLEVPHVGGAHADFIAGSKYLGDVYGAGIGYNINNDGSPLGHISAWYGGLENKVVEFTSTSWNFLTPFYDTNVSHKYLNLPDSRLRTLDEIINAGSVNVKDFATGDGITDDYAAIVKARDYAITHSLPLVFPNGTYNISSTLELAHDAFHILALGPSVNIVHQGSGRAVSFDGTTTTGGATTLQTFGGPNIFNIFGNANTTDLLYTSNVHHASFRARVRDGECGWRNNNTVLNRIELICSGNEGAFVKTPLWGAFLNQLYAAECHLIIEQCGGSGNYGLYLESSFNNNFQGTSEGCLTGGAYIGVNSTRNTFIGFDNEVNGTGYDWLVDGDGNTFISCTGHFTGIGSRVSGDRNVFIGCFINGLEIGAGATNNKLDRCDLSELTSTGQGFVDSGTNTEIVSCVGIDDKGPLIDFTAPATDAIKMPVILNLQERERHVGEWGVSFDYLATNSVAAAATNTVRMQNALDSGERFIRVPGLVPIEAGLVMSKPCRLVGDQMRASGFVGVSLSDTDPTLLIQPSASDTDEKNKRGWAVQELAFLLHGGQNQGYVPVQVDTGSGASQFLSGLQLDRLYIPQDHVPLASDGTSAPRLSILHTNSNSTGGWFAGQITNSWLGAGIKLEDTGDSLGIRGNTITGYGIGVDMQPIAGAAKQVIEFNNITNLSGAILLTSGEQVIVNNNQIECQGTYDGIYDAQIVLNNCLGCSVFDNNVNSVGNQIDNIALIGGSADNTIDRNTLATNVFSGTLRHVSADSSPNNWIGAHNTTYQANGGARTRTRIFVTEEVDWRELHHDWIQNGLEYGDWVADDTSESAGLARGLYMKRSGRLVNLKGAIKPGTITPGTVIAAFFYDFWPTELRRINVIALADGVLSEAYFKVTAGGGLIIEQLPSFSSSLMLQFDGSSYEV